MTYPYPANIIPIAEEVISRIQAAGATFSTPVDPSNVYYGDQDRIPATPSICIDPGDKTRSLAGAPNMTLNEFEIYVIIYHNKIQEMQLTRKEADQLAYEVEFMLEPRRTVIATVAREHLLKLKGLAYSRMAG